MTYFKNTLIVASLLAATLATDAFAVGGRARYQNAAGGVTSSAGHAYRGANGGGFARGRRIQTDGAGNVSGVSGAAGITANGGYYHRKGSFSRSADGSATRQGNMAASGQRGSVDSSGSATRNPDGSVNGNRSTQVTNAQTGVTKDINSNYTSGQGVTRTATCVDAMGVSVACPTR